MARAKDNLKIAVEQLTEGDERVITVTIVAKAADFVLPDLLSDQGAIDSYASGLSKAVKEATENYLQEAKDAVAAIAERKQGRQAIAPERPPKQAETGKGAGSSAPRAVQERGNGPVAAPSLSGS